MLALLLALASAQEANALYFVLVDRFADGRPDAPGSIDPADPQAWHGGDLAGVLAHYDEIPGEGLWLSPIQRARTEPVGEWGAFHGYWTTHLDQLEPRLATDAELRALSAKAKVQGKELWLDLVTNHVGYDAPLLTAHPDWFHGKGDVVDWGDPVQAVTHDVHGLPDLAQENEAVYAHLLAAATHWVNVAHPTGFRVDAVRHVPEGFLARLRDDLRLVDPELQLLGEVFEGDAAKLSARQRADRLDRVFDFPLHYALKDAVCGGDLGRLAGVVALDSVYDDPGSLVTFLDNHDVARIRSACGDDLDAVARALAVMTLLRGTPCITWGTEAGLAGAEEPANRADMVFEPAPLRSAIDALLALRRSSDALGRHAPTKVLDVEDQRVVLGRMGAESHAVLVVTGEQATSWPVGAGCEAWVVAGQQGPVSVAVDSAFAVPAHAVGVLRCAGKPDSGVLARAFAPDPPLRTVHIMVPDGHALVGSSEALGAWQAAKGLPSKEGKVTLRVPSGTVLEYKFVRDDGDGRWSWPDTGNTVQRVP